MLHPAAPFKTKDSRYSNIRWVVRQAEVWTSTPMWAYPESLSLCPYTKTWILMRNGFGLDCFSSFTALTLFSCCPAGWHTHSHTSFRLVTEVSDCGHTQQPHTHTWNQSDRPPTECAGVCVCVCVCVIESVPCLLAVTVAQQPIHTHVCNYILVKTLIARALKTNTNIDP